MYRTACGGVKLTMLIKTTASAAVLWVFWVGCHLLSWTWLIEKVHNLISTPRPLRTFPWCLQLIGWMALLCAATVFCLVYTMELTQNFLPGGLCTEKHGVWEFVKARVFPQQDVCGLFWIGPRAAAAFILTHEAWKFVMNCPYFY